MAQPPIFEWATSTGGLVVGPLTITAAEWVGNQQAGDVLYGLIKYTCSGGPNLSAVLQSHRLDVSGFSDALNNGVHYIVSADNTAKTITVRMTARTDATADQTGASAAGNVYDLGALLQEPSGAKQGQGYIPNELPNAQQLNWMLNNLGSWTDYIANELPDDLPPDLIELADLAALAAYDIGTLTRLAVLVRNVGIYRWVSGSALTADGYTVIDSSESGQWVLEAASPQAVVATDDLSVARGGRYIVDAATEKTLTLPATINPGYEIEIVNQGAGGFNLLTNDGQKLRDADTEYGPAVVQLESIDPYTAVRLMATDTDTFSIVSKNGTINTFVRDEIWQAYTKTAFSTTSTSYVDAQSVAFETRFTGSRILALVSFDSTGTNSLGQMAVTFDGGAVDFEFTRTATGDVNDASLVLPQLSGVLSKGSHTVAVRVKAEATRTFQGNVRITLLEVKSDMYLNSSSWTGTGTSIGSNDLGSMALTFSGTPSILAAGVFSHVGSVFGTYHIRNVTAAGAMGSFPETNYGATNNNTGSIVTLVKSGGTNYPTSGNNIAFNVNFAAAETVSGRLYAIALPTSDITRFEDSIDVPGTVSGTTWVTRRSLSVTLAATADLYVFVSGHADLNGHRGRMRVLLDSVDVTDTILMHDSAVGTQPSANYGIVLPDVTSGTKSLELQFSTDNASGTATITSAVISALSVKTR